MVRSIIHGSRSISSRGQLVDTQAPDKDGEGRITNLLAINLARTEVYSNYSSIEIAMNGVCVLERYCAKINSFLGDRLIKKCRVLEPRGG